MLLKNIIKPRFIYLCGIATENNIIEPNITKISSLK